MAGFRWNLRHFMYSALITPNWRFQYLPSSTTDSGLLWRSTSNGDANWHVVFFFIMTVQHKKERRKETFRKLACHYNHNEFQPTWFINNLIIKFIEKRAQHFARTLSAYIACANSAKSDCSIGFYLSNAIVYL